MLSLTSGSIMASTCFEAFLQVAATTVGVVAAFTLYVLVLVTLHVTKIVSNVFICVGDFLDMLADELIVCMYEKADHIVMPSQPVRALALIHIQNMTTEEEVDSATPLPEHVLFVLPSHLQNNHIAEPTASTPAAPEPVPFVCLSHAQTIVTEETIAAEQMEDAEPVPVVTSSHPQEIIEEPAVAEPAPVMLPLPEPVRVPPTPHSQENHIEEPMALEQTLTDVVIPHPVFFLPYSHIQGTSVIEDPVAFEQAVPVCVTGEPVSFIRSFHSQEIVNMEEPSEKTPISFNVLLSLRSHTQTIHIEESMTTDPSPAPQSVHPIPRSHPQEIIEEPITESVSAEDSVTEPVPLCFSPYTQGMDTDETVAEKTTDTVSVPQPVTVRPPISLPGESHRSQSDCSFTPHKPCSSLTTRVFLLLFSHSGSHRGACDLGVGVC